jgi:hypothetical protein
MATKAQQHHAERQRTGAAEPTRTDTSTRRTEQPRTTKLPRSKPDAALNITEEVRKGSPEARFSRDRAKSIRTRGHA